MTTIHTVGHSTRPIEEFIELLHGFGITQLVDIRTVPRSRHNSQFEQDTLRGSLEAAGITYRHLAELGGLRPSRKGSINLGWRNASFRNYADYMQTEGFEQGLQGLLALADEKPTAIMCAEAVPWRCHRSLVGDALLVRGVTVLDIIGSGAPKPHTLTSFAVVDGTTVTYPAYEDGSAEGGEE